MWVFRIVVRVRDRVKAMFKARVKSTDIFRFSVRVNCYG